MEKDHYSQGISFFPPLAGGLYKVQKKTKKLLRISELAERAGVSKSTIKHYVNDGLLPSPVKTSKNMAYYDESCVEKIRFIKKIQKERFLPLDVIKRLIDSGKSYDEELELSKAILKSHKISPGSIPVRESKIERLTGYPLDKIHILEQEGVILPFFKNHIKYYDEADCKIIEIMKIRENLGVPFDYSLETIRIYRDSILKAVNEDIHLFTRSFIGDIPTKQAIKFMTEADETLDSFMVLFRYKMLRTISEGIIGEINDLPHNLALLNIFPIEGRYLPGLPPKDIFLKMGYYFCKGEYESAARLAGERLQGKVDPGIAAFAILADLLIGEVGEAIKKVERYIPKPCPRTLENTTAALAYLFSIGQASGLSVPMYYTKKMLAYLKRIEISEERHVLVKVFSRYVCGAIYIVLPKNFETRGDGIEMLSRLNKLLTGKKIRKENLPEWLAKTLDFEILPALEIRTNRFLAEGYLGQGVYGEALKCLERIIEIADPEGEHSNWARMKRVEIKR